MSFVPGSIVNTTTGQVHGLDNFLAGGATPTVTVQGEVVFRDLVETSMAVAGDLCASYEAISRRHLDGIKRN